VFAFAAFGQQKAIHQLDVEWTDGAVAPESIVVAKILIV
jgi:hypothetical protein